MLFPYKKEDVQSCHEKEVLAPRTLDPVPSETAAGWEVGRGAHPVPAGCGRVGFSGRLRPQLSGPPWLLSLEVAGPGGQASFPHIGAYKGGTLLPKPGDTQHGDIHPELSDSQIKFKDA